jgi:alpha-tubulin suppressor-like RCC1 family protein
MSLRYTGAWLQDGAFNPLAAPTPIVDYTYDLYSWGNGTNGQLGNGTSTSVSSPVQIGSTGEWLVFAAGYQHNLAIKPNNTLWAWGNGGGGRLGLGNTTSYSSPKQVGALTDWLYIATIHTSSFAIKKDGTMWSWGVNGKGQLGLGDTTNRSSPVQIGALTNWAKFASREFVLAITTTGELYSWGANNQGQLGNGNTTYTSSPVQVGALTTWASAACGPSQSYLIKTDGTMWVCGYGAAYGSLGLNNANSYSSPKQLGALTNWLQVASGNYVVSAVKTDGTLWAWGRNNDGQLGQGNTSYAVSSPIQVGALTNWSKTSCGNAFCLATKTDGTLWAWGNNSYGQLGQNNTTYRSSPVQVGSLTSWSIPYANSNDANAFII